MYRIHSKYIHSIKYGRFTTLLVTIYALQKYCIWFWRRTIPNMWGVINSITNLQRVILSLYQNKWISTSCYASNKQIALAVHRDIYILLAWNENGDILMASSGYNSNQKRVSVLTVKKSSQINGGSYLCKINYSHRWQHISSEHLGEKHVICNYEKH